MDAPRTLTFRSLLAGAILTLAFAVALTMLLGAASADAHSRTKRPTPRKQAAAHPKKHKVAVKNKGRNSWSSPGPSTPSIGENQATTDGGPTPPPTRPPPPPAHPPPPPPPPLPHQATMVLMRAPERSSRIESSRPSTTRLSE
jgi:hypothetical protein